MQVHTLQAGDEVRLDGDIRITVLSVTEDTVFLEISLPGAEVVRVTTSASVANASLAKWQAIPPSTN